MKNATMLAAVFERSGEPSEVLQLRELPLPVPSPGEVLVRMQAASLHPADRMFIGGSYRSQPVFPQRAGLVGTGVVVPSGEAAPLPPGTRVALRHPGAWAEYCAVPAARVFVVPEGITAAAASQFALNPVTAWALLAAADARPGDWLAVNAAGSNVAALVRGLAAARGVRVLPVERAAPAGQTLAQGLLAASGGEPVAALLDAVGGPPLVEALAALRTGATIVSYGLLSDAPAPMRNADLIARNLRWIGFGIDHWLAGHLAQREPMARELWSAIADGALPLPVRARHPLAALDTALDADAQGGEGKVLLTMEDGA